MSAYEKFITSIQSVISPDLQVLVVKLPNKSNGSPVYDVHINPFVCVTISESERILRLASGRSIIHQNADYENFARTIKFFLVQPEQDERKIDSLD